MAGQLYQNLAEHFSPGTILSVFALYHVNTDGCSLLCLANSQRSSLLNQPLSINVNSWLTAL